MGGVCYNHYLASKATPDYGWDTGLRLSGRRLFLDALYTCGLKDQGGFRYSDVIGMLGFHL